LKRTRTLLSAVACSVSPDPMEIVASRNQDTKAASMLQRYNIQSESDIREPMQLRETRIQTQQQENPLAVPPVTKQVQ
jgi:hypothetical protein